MSRTSKSRRGVKPFSCLLVGVTAFVMATAANAATTHRAWSGAAGDYTDPTMWVDGIVSGPGECADLSTTGQGAGIAYIREGMNITNGWINCGRTNDFTIIMTGGYVQLTQSEKVSDAALKISRGEDVSGGDPLRPDGTMTISGGLFNVANGCVSVGERGYGVLTMTGGELWAKGRLSIAYLAGSSGKMTVSGGAKASAASFNLVRPAATLIVDGGTLAQSKKLTVTPFANNFIWGDTGATVQIGAGGAVLDVCNFDAMATLPISSVPGTAGNLEKRGVETLRFTGTATNTYAGATVVAEGTLFTETPHNLPGYDEPGRVTVRAGARLVFGDGWTEAEKAIALSNITMEPGASIGATFNVSGDDVTISDDLSYTGGMEKLGDKMLTLTGHNTFGGEQKIWEGTLRADFGTGLDSGYCVTLAGGSLSSVSGSLVTTIGSGAGQVNIVSGFTPTFTARGVPLSVNLLNGTSPQNYDNNNRIYVTESFPSYSLTLNDVNADQPITFCNNIDIRGTTTDNFFKMSVLSGTATMTGSLMDGVYQQSKPTTFKKYGAGTLRLAGIGVRDRMVRFNVEEGDVVIDHPASVASSANGSCLFFFLNKNGSGTLSATNQTIVTDDNFNNNTGFTRFKGGKLTVKGSLLVRNADVLFDGGTVSVAKNLQVGNEADTSGVCTFTNGVRVTLTGSLSEFAAGSDNNNVNGRIEIFDDCCVTSKIVGAGSGAIVQHGGTVYANGGTAPTRIGRHSGRRGFYFMNGGEFGSASTLSLGRVGGAYGLVWQTGGTICPNTDVVIGEYTDSKGVATGVVHVVGGELRNGAGYLYAGKDGLGELTVRGEGVVRATNVLSVAHESTTGKGRVMLCKGGMIVAPQVLGHGTTDDERYADFVFDGGTLRASADSATYVSNLTSFAVGTGGGAVDTDGHDVTFAQPLTATSLNSDLAHRWSFNGDYVDSVAGETAIDNKGGTFIDQGEGQAVQLKGGNKGTSYVSLGPKKLPVDGSECTIEFWARVDTHRNWQRAFDIGKDGTAFFALTFRRTDVNTDYCGIKYNGVQNGAYDSLVTYDVGKKPWSHICVVCKKGDDGRWKIRGYRKYRDGEDIVKRFEYDAPEGWSLANQDQTYTYIGRSLQNNYDTSAAFDEFRIWKRALTDEEIEANGDLGPDALPATVFEKRGAGRLTLTGANTYAQPTVVSGGTLALAAGASLPASTAITVADGATLDLGGNAAAAASLSGAGTLANGTLALTGAADISSMSFALADGVLPASNEPVVVLEAAGGVTGRFSSATLPRGCKLTYSGNQVRLAKKGLFVIVR